MPNGCGKRKTATNDTQLNKIKTADKASISNTGAKSTEISLKEAESNRALNAVKDEWC